MVGEKNRCAAQTGSFWSCATVALCPCPLLFFYTVCPDNWLILMDVPLFGSTHTLFCAWLLRPALPCWWWEHWVEDNLISILLLRFSRILVIICGQGRKEDSRCNFLISESTRLGKCQMPLPSGCLAACMQVGTVGLFRVIIFSIDRVPSSRGRPSPTG